MKKIPCMQAIVCVDYKIIYVLGPFLCVHFLILDHLNQSPFLGVL